MGNDRYALGVPSRRSSKRFAYAAIVILAATMSAGDVGYALADVSQGADANGSGKLWIGTWAAAAQPFIPQVLAAYENQTLRLIVHTSAGGKKVRIRISNTYGDRGLQIGGAHIARRTAEAEIDPRSDRVLKFQGQSSVTVAPGASVLSDPAELEVPALSDLAVSIFLPQRTEAKTSHQMAKQTSYVSPQTGDSSAAVKFPVANTIQSWPLLTGVDVEAWSGSAAVVAFGSSLTDGDGTTADTNRRWPDVLAERLNKSSEKKAPIGVLNEGIIGNRLLHDSPKGEGNPFGGALGESGLARFQRDVLDQAGVKYAIIGLGINDILFPAFPFTPATETVSAEDIIAGYRKLIALAHKKGIRVIGTTNPPFERSAFPGFVTAFYTPERETVRQKVNDWIRSSGEFDAMVDLDAAVRDPSHPTQLLPAYDSGDHLHPNDAGCAVEANAIPLALFAR
jgi:lysophospholipase L1-like esterase